LIDKLEEEFGVEIDSGLISPENFATPERIAGAVLSSLARVRRREDR
jgi:acyl carrier protein